MNNSACELTIDESRVARIRLNRPESHNALNPELLELFEEYLKQVDENQEIRSLELCSAGKHFCSGLDLKWLRESANSASADLDKEFYRLGRILHRLYHLSKPTVAIVQGAAYGGGAGLVCCCDIALASPGTRFCFSEVRLGLIPSVISPFVIQAVGERIVRRYFLTAERIEASEAHRINLVHEVVESSCLRDRANQLHRALGLGAPNAISRIKSLLASGERMPLSTETLQKTSAWLNETRDSDEAREGVAAFLGKHNPKWVQ